MNVVLHSGRQLGFGDQFNLFEASFKVFKE
jgi:hypothetical protein